MSIKDKYHVQPIKKEETYEWLLYKHYAKRLPLIMIAFGLFNNKKKLIGICTYGLGGNVNNNTYGKYKMLELNRLCIDECTEKNLLSFFVSKTFSLMENPIVLISYSDKKQNHSGYIYQATNWIYTGLSSKEKTIIKNNKEYHRKSLFDKYGTSSENYLKTEGYEILKPHAKHRYFMFLGSKKQKKEMLKALKYPILPYPKGDNKRYDASYKPAIQKRLF